MKPDIHISNYQMLTLLVMHSLGSTTLFALGGHAKQDAWIVVLLALILGFAMLWLHTELQSCYPDKNLAEINVILFGKLCGGFITLTFAGYFIWISTLNFSEFAELIVITSLPDTPLLAIQLSFVLVIVYLTFKNIEVLGRLGELLMPITIFGLFSIFLFLIASGKIHINNLQPVLAKGWGPILKEAYPTFSTFPYGEDVVFLMYYCYVNESNAIRKYAFAAIALLGGMLTISTILILTVLGVTITEAATIPLIEVTKMINIANIITNIDAIAVVTIFIGGLFKSMLFFYGSVLALTTLFKLKREAVIIAMAIFLVCANLTAIPNFIFHRFVGISFTNSYIQELYTIFMPALLLINIWLIKLNKKLKGINCDYEKVNKNANN